MSGFLTYEDMSGWKILDKRFFEENIHLFGWFVGLFVLILCCLSCLLIFPCFLELFFELNVVYEFVIRQRGIWRFGKSSMYFLFLQHFNDEMHMFMKNLESLQTSMGYHMLPILIFLNHIFVINCWLNRFFMSNLRVYCV